MKTGQLATRYKYFLLYFEEWRWGNVNEWGDKAECVGWTLWKASQSWIWLGPCSHVQGTPLEGQPIPITIDMVKKAISKMKSGKAAGPSGIVVEMNKAAGDMVPPWSAILLLRLPGMARSQLTGSKVSMSAFKRAKVMLWIEASIKASSWQSRPWWS